MFSKLKNFAQSDRFLKELHVAVLTFPKQLNHPSALSSLILVEFLSAGRLPANPKSTIWSALAGTTCLLIVVRLELRAPLPTEQCKHSLFTSSSPSLCRWACLRSIQRSQSPCLWRPRPSSYVVLSPTRTGVPQLWTCSRTSSSQSPAARKRAKEDSQVAFTLVVKTEV